MREREEKGLLSGYYDEECCGCKKEKNCFERLRYFWKDIIAANSCSFTDILSLFVDGDFLKETFTFWIEILWDDKIIILKDETGAETELISRKWELCDQETEKAIIWKRCIGMLPCERKIYYCIKISRESIDDNCIDLTFLHCAEKVYYEWIVELLSDIMHTEHGDCVVDTRIEL